MRTTTRRAAALIASLILTACSSGTVIVVRPPAPPPPPPRPRLAPLEVTLARPVRGHLLVQTNRPSYVALFEIVPGRGVALLAPAHKHQRTWMLAGLNWVPVSWKVQSTLYYGRPAGTSVPARWVYALASDEPLHLPDEAFHPSYMRRALGLAAYRATNPYLTMRAIARAFVPSVVDEAWAEDAYALPATYASDPYRTVRIYCANRTVYEVPEEVADRAWCPVASGTTIVRSTPARPDSVVATGGRRIRIRMPETTPVRAPIDRVTEPPASDHAPIANDREAPRNDDVVERPKDVKDAKDRRGNGNAYGHTDDPNVKGRGIEDEKRDDPRRTPRVDTPVNNNPSETQPDRVEQRQQRELEKEVRTEQKQEQKADRVEQRDEKAEQRVDHKADQAEQKVDRRDSKADKPAVTPEPRREPEVPATKQEPTPEPKAEPTHEAQPEPKADDRSAKSDDKPEAKSDNKPETKADDKPETKADEKSTGKPDDKPGGKPEDKGTGKPDEPGKKENKGKP